MVVVEGFPGTIFVVRAGLMSLSTIDVTVCPFSGPMAVIV